MKNAQPPKDGLIRAARPGLEIRAAEDGGMPRLTGYMLRFGEWTEIDSAFEGNFYERVAPGATKKTLAEGRESMRILFNHGHDPHIGEKPLAEPELIEDSKGVRYDEPELFDTSYNRDLIPSLKAGQLGSSFRFRVTSEQFDRTPEPSDYNPDGIPERTITELQLYEGGPVTFPAYEGSSAGARSRSLTDEMFIAELKRDPARYPELEELFRSWVTLDPERARSLLERAMSIEESDQCPSDRPWAVMSGTEMKSCHATKEEAETEMEGMGRSQPPEEPAKVPSEPSGSNSGKHSPGAETASHSKAGRALEASISGSPPKRALEKSLGKGVEK